MSQARHDIEETTLAWALARSPNPDTLSSLVRLSRQTFGWFSKQCSRSFEYPWVISQIGPPIGKPVLDIGTGISPLPLYLAERGLTVVTLDHSPIVRKLGQDQTTWNGWGFFDYSTLNRTMRSYNQDVVTARFPPASFAVVYSVSVVEHMPTAIRRQLWDRVHTWLRPKGVLLLTVDLEPGTDLLWNQNQGKQVEAPEIHGDLQMITDELGQVGLRCTQREYMRDLPGDARGDIAMFRLERS